MRDTERLLRELIRELRLALARERGGGTPLSSAEYIELNDRARKAVNNDEN